MSTKLGTLTLDLVAKIGNFVGPIKDGEKQVKLSFDNMRKNINSYGAVMASVGAGAVTALAGMALQTANQAAELEKFAFRANTTTQDFQKMTAGAGAFGIEQEKLSDMMKDFNEKLGELTAIGAGGGVDFFEKIAIKTEGSSEAAKKLILDMQKLSGPEALQLYVDKLEKAGVTQQQMSFYLESMASDMTDLYPLLANGGEGMRLYGDMAERAGLIMNDNTIESAKALKDQVYMLDLQLQGAKNQLMQAVVPAFVDVADAFLGGSEQGLQFSGVADGIADSLRFVAKMAIGVVTSIQLAGKAMGAVYGSIQSNKDWYEVGPLGYAKAMFDARGDIASIGKSYISDANEMLLDAGEKMDAIDRRAGSSKANQLRGIREIQQNLKQTNGGLDELADKQNKTAKATSGANKALAEQNRLLEQQAREKISYDYLDDFAKFAEDKKRQIAEIQKANFGPQEAEYLAKAKARYEHEEEMYLRKITEEIHTFKWSEEQKLDYHYETQRIIVSESGKNNDEIKELKLKALDEQYAIELEKTRFHAQNMRQEMQDSISSLAVNTDDIFAKATMSAPDYAKWSLDNERSNSRATLKQKKISVEQNIATSDVFESEDERYEALLQANQEYRDALYAIDLQYDQQVKDLARSQYDAQMGIWQDLLSRTGTIFSQMAEMVKSTAGESSAAYKAMFFTNQAISMAQALINTEVAATKALAEGGMVAGIPMATAIRVLGYASVGMIGAQTIAGMAHDGIDNVPKEGTWLLDKGERVVDSRTNADLKNYLASGRGSGGDTTIQVNVTDSGVSTQSSGDQKQLGDMIGNAVRAIIMKEKRQGGLLS